MSSNGVPCRSYDGTRETSAPVLVVVWRGVADFVVECPRSLKGVFGTEGCLNGSNPAGRTFFSGVKRTS